MVSAPEPVLLASSQLSASSRSSNPRVIQLSDDNQFVFVTGKALDLITTHTCLGPVREELGQRDMSTGFYQSAWNLQNNLPLDEDQKESAVPAILESRLKHLDAKIFVPHVDEATEWYAESEDVRTMVVGQSTATDDITWRTACWSPTGLSALHGCLIAALTSNLDVFIYEPESDAINGRWNLTNSLSQVLLERSREDVPPEGTEDLKLYRIAQVLKLQSQCLSWSPQLVWPSLKGRGDWSILAVGHRGGNISLWAKSKRSTRMELLQVKQVSSEIVSVIAWSSWSYSSESEAIAQLAFASPSGAVHVLSVSRSAADPSAIAFSEPEQLLDPDRRPLTSLEWVSPDMLVFTKCGQAGIWTRMHGILMFRLQRIGNWAGCSKLASCAGISLLSSSTLAISLSDSSTHYFDGIDTPTATYNIPRSRYMTKTTRSIFERLEAPRRKKGDLDLREVSMQLAGILSLGRGVWVWLHQLLSPYTVDYSIPNEVHSQAVFLEIPTHTAPQFGTYLAQFRAMLAEPHNSLLSAPSRSITPILYQPLASPEFKSAVMAPILEAISQYPDARVAADVEDLRVPSNVSEARLSLRDGLREDLWGATGLGRLRIRYSLASFLATVESDEQVLFERRRDDLARLIVLQSLTIILGWLDKFQALIGGPQDLSLLTRLIHAHLCLSLHPPYTHNVPRASLSFAAGGSFDLATVLQLSVDVDPTALEGLLVGDEQHPLAPPPAQVQNDVDMDAGGPEAGPPVQHAYREGDNERGRLDVGAPGNVGQLCPGCGAGVAMLDLEVATCFNGHVWDRCSMTFSLIATPSSRKCYSCSRVALFPTSFVQTKAALPDLSSEGMPKEEEDGDEEGVNEREGEALAKTDWVMEELLRAATCCLYCGGRYHIPV